MTCKTIHTHLDDFIDGSLDGAAMAACEQHLGTCADCAAMVTKAREIRGLLGAYGAATVSMPGDDFYARALARATRDGSRRQRNRWVMSGVGGTIAAALLVWVMSGFFFTAPELPQADVPAVTMALEQPRKLNLVFSSAAALTDATMTVVLPEGIEVDGFPGQREIVWMTSLKEGRNVLPLTLIATSPAGGELLATLRHENDDKAFRVRVTVI